MGPVTDVLTSLDVRYTYLGPLRPVSRRTGTLCVGREEPVVCRNGNPDLGERRVRGVLGLSYVKTNYVRYEWS